MPLRDHDRSTPWGALALCRLVKISQVSKVRTDSGQKQKPKLSCPQFRPSFGGPSRTSPSIYSFRPPTPSIPDFASLPSFLTPLPFPFVLSFPLSLSPPALLFSLCSLWLPLFSARRGRLAPPPAFSPASLFVVLLRSPFTARLESRTSYLPIRGSASPREFYFSTTLPLGQAGRQRVEERRTRRYISPAFRPRPAAPGPERLSLPRRMLSTHQAQRRRS